MRLLATFFLSIFSWSLLQMNSSKNRWWIWISGSISHLLSICYFLFLQAIADSLIHKILYSKRLLVDHVEALEQCMVFMQEQSSSLTAANTSQSRDTTDFASRSRAVMKSLVGPEIFTARNTCLLLGSTVLEHIITPRALRLMLIPSAVVAGSFSALYVVKTVFGFRNKIVERELENLVRTIDDFGNCIRRNMTYFNEIIIMKQHELIE